MAEHDTTSLRVGRFALMFAALALVVACAAGGYLVGDSTDPTPADAAAERQQARVAERSRPAESAYRVGYKRGEKQASSRAGPAAGSSVSGAASALAKTQPRTPSP
jgi:hypothetical protein